MRPQDPSEKLKPRFFGAGSSIDAGDFSVVMLSPLGLRVRNVGRPSRDGVGGRVEGAEWKVSASEALAMVWIEVEDCEGEGEGEG